MRNFPLWALIAVAGSSFADTDGLMSLEELCKVDKFCTNLKTPSGGVMGISPVFRKLIENYRDIFIDTAERYGVDPRAPIAAVAAENTMNVQVSDDVQNWLAHRGITVRPDQNGKLVEFSFGLGQINMPAALEAEAHMAKIDNRPQRTSVEVRKALLTLDGAAYYATGIVRKAQDAYKDKGIDISGRPEILATLYNLGRPVDKAAQAAATGAKPQVNYFGYFVAHNMKDLEGLLGWDPVKKKRTKPRVSEEMISADSSFIAVKALQMQTAMPLCNLDGAGDFGRYNSVMSRREFPKGPAAAGPFKVIGQGVDCDMKDAVQVQFLNGQRGWIPAAVLQDPDSGIVRSRTPLKLVCSAEDGKKCLAKIKAEMGGEIINNDSLAMNEENLITVGLSTTDNQPMKNSFKKPGIASCAGSGRMHGFGSPTKTSAAELEELEKKIEQIKADVVRRLELSGWHDPDNPVRGAFDDTRGLARCKQAPQRCQLSVSSVNSFRGGSVGDLLKLDSGKKDLGEVLTFLQTRRLEAYVEEEPNERALEEFKQRSRASLAQARESCRGLLEETDLEQRFKSIEALVGTVQERHMKWGRFEIHGTLSETGTRCRAIERYLNNQEDAADPYVKLEIYSNGTFGKFPMKTIKKLKPSRAQLLEGLTARVTQMEAGMADSMRYDSGSSCQMDVFKTLGLMEKLAQDPCVDQVIVPDRFFLTAARGAHVQKMIFGESDEKSFQVQLNGCKSGMRGSMREYLKGVR